jgi:hypothetical protein
MIRRNMQQSTSERQKSIILLANNRILQLYDEEEFRMYVGQTILVAYQMNRKENILKRR